MLKEYRPISYQNMKNSIFDYSVCKIVVYKDKRLINQTHFPTLSRFVYKKIIRKRIPNAINWFLLCFSFYPIIIKIIEFYLATQLQVFKIKFNLKTNWCFLNANLETSSKFYKSGINLKFI